MALLKNSSSSLLPFLPLLALQLLLWLTQTSALSYAKPGCQEYCGNVPIPYPFGIGPRNCYFDKWFSIECKNPSSSSSSSNGVAPYLIKIGLKVLDISLNGNYLQVNNPVTSPNCAINNNNVNSSPSDSSVDLRSSPFRFSETNNVFMAVDLNCSSNQMATFNNLADNTITQCWSSCDPNNNSNNISSCSDEITWSMQYLQGYKVYLGGITNSTIQSGVQSCLYAFLVDKQAQVSMGMNLSVNDPVSMGTNTSFNEAVPTHVPAVLEWVYNTTDLGLVADKSYSCLPSSLAYSSLSDDKCVVVQTLQCVCNFPFSGNPYFSNGCRDTSIKPPKPHAVIIIGVCAGIAGGLFLLIAFGWLYKVMKKRNDEKHKENFFKRNGGFLLQHKLSSTNGSEKIKLFNSKELEKATY